MSKHDRIATTPGVQGGQPCIVGTRITVTSIWAWHRVGYDTEAIIREYPGLTQADVLAAIAYHEREEERSR